jgi:hypothetical protein
MPQKDTLDKLRTPICFRILSMSFTSVSIFSVCCYSSVSISVVHTLTQVKACFTQCCGSGMFIPDPTFFHPGSELSPSRIPDPKKSKKMVSKLYKIWSGLFIPDPGSGIRMLTSSYPGSRIQGSKRHPIPDPGSRIRIRNTGFTILAVIVYSWCCSYRFISLLMYSWIEYQIKVICLFWVGTYWPRLQAVYTKNVSYIDFWLGMAVCLCDW